MDEEELEEELQDEDEVIDTTEGCPYCNSWCMNCLGLTWRDFA